MRPYYEEPSTYLSILESYSWVTEKQMLPEPGTWRDQSSVLVAYWKVLDVAFRDAEKMKAGAKPKPTVDMAQNDVSKKPRERRGRLRKEDG